MNRKAMQYLYKTILALGISGLLIQLFQLRLWAGIPVFLLCGLFLFLNQRSLARRTTQKQRLDEICLYLEILLYSFEREGKIIRSLEAAEDALPEGRLKDLLAEGLWRQTADLPGEGDTTQIFRTVEEAYPCRRVKMVHDFMRHVEDYGGERRTPIQFLLEDKNRWERRLLSRMEEDRTMHRQVLLSVLASLGICGLIAHMPGMDSMSGNRFTQSVTILYLLLDAGILLLAGRMLEKDRLLQGEEYRNAEKEKKDKKEKKEKGTKEICWQQQMQEYGSYDEVKEARKSCLYALPTLPAAGFFLWKQQWWWLIAMLFLTLFLMRQHIVGRNIQRKRLDREILRAFPSWMLDLILLLQSENVAVALAKSADSAPEILQGEIRELTEQMDLAAENPATYRGFLADFPHPQIQRAMTGLYLMVTGNGDEEGRQLQDLIRINQDMQDEADTQFLREQSSGLYLLFLAPVLTASIKLLADMGVYLIQFLAVL